MDIQLRQKILQFLYKERLKRVQTLDREDLVRFIGRPWSVIQPEVAYLEEKGYVVTRSMQIGVRIFHILNITPQGVNALERGQTVQKIAIFISSPGDVYEERQIALRVIERFNKRNSVASRYFLKPLAYEEIVPAVVGQRPQAIVDNYMMEAATADIFVCILWQRMGTPVLDEETGEQFQSGTEYEFLSAYRSNLEHGKPFILLYQSMKPYPLEVDHEQLHQVQSFFKRFEGECAELKGLYKTYHSNEEFERILDHDLDAIIEKNFS
jgi:hypothetical protein